MRRKNEAVKVAYPAVLGALAVVLVHLACLVPTGRWGIVALAGLLPAAAVISVGLKAGFLCWAGASILALLLVPDKFCAVLFTALFGLYPMVKSLAEKPRKRLLEYAVKLGFFNAVFTALYAAMMGSMLDSLPPVLGSSLWALYPAANIVFVLYDYGSSQLISAYIRRVGRAVR